MIIADTNSYHGLQDAVAYKNATEADGSNHPVVIMKATEGTSYLDPQYAPSLAKARSAGVYVGHYHFLDAAVDAVAQGTFFANVVLKNGGLKYGDTIWCDCEQGSGDEFPRVNAFLAQAHSILHDPSVKDEGVYSGASFWAAHLGSVNTTGYLRWIAAYGVPNPPPGSQLWQFADNRTMAGVAGPCDASIFNGKIADWLALAGYGVTPVPAPVNKDRNVNAPPAGPLVYVPGLGVNDYWQCCTDGGVFNFGAAPFYGSRGGQPLNSPVVGMAATPSGKGYWLACADGGIFNYGDAPFYGSHGGQPLNKPVEAISVTPSGLGYILRAHDGGLFTYGDAVLDGRLIYTGS